MEYEPVPLEFTRLDAEEALRRSQEMYDLLATRRSVRHFSDEPVPLDVMSAPREASLIVARPREDAVLPSVVNLVESGALPREFFISGTYPFHRINDAFVDCFPTAADIVMGRPVPVQPGSSPAAQPEGARQ